MTDQPTKDRFSTIDSILGIQVHDNTIKKSIALLVGPDREANAALFIRAQHMDELVEAAQPFAELATDIEEAANLYEGPESDPNNWAKSCDWADLARLRDILAKIKGDK